MLYVELPVIEHLLHKLYESFAKVKPRPEFLVAPGYRVLSCWKGRIVKTGISHLLQIGVQLPIEESKICIGSDRIQNRLKQCVMIRRFVHACTGLWIPLFTCLQNDALYPLVLVQFH